MRFDEMRRGDEMGEEGEKRERRRDGGREEEMRGSEEEMIGREEERS